MTKVVSLRMRSQFVMTGLHKVAPPQKETCKQTTAVGNLINVKTNRLIDVEKFAKTVLAGNTSAPIPENEVSNQLASPEAANQPAPQLENAAIENSDTHCSVKTQKIEITLQQACLILSALKLDNEGREENDCHRAIVCGKKGEKLIIQINSASNSEDGYRIKTVIFSRPSVKRSNNFYTKYSNNIF